MSTKWKLFSLFLLLRGLFFTCQPPVRNSSAGSYTFSSSCCGGPASLEPAPVSGCGGFLALASGAGSAGRFICSQVAVYEHPDS